MKFVYTFSCLISNPDINNHTPQANGVKVKDADAGVEPRPGFTPSSAFPSCVRQTSSFHICKVRTIITIKHLLGLV
jgi:hypothetical protein